VTDRRAFSVAIFAVHDGEVLLVEHKRLGLWIPVGGEVEPNETPLEAAKRELLEETGLEGDFSARSPIGVPGTPPGLIAYEEHPAGSKGLHLNFCFAARVPSRDLKSDGSWAAARWVREAPAESPENVKVAVRRALALLE
jgi:ADP-ribose pyrophosphatase YjhB (NUDIX family)